MKVFKINDKDDDDDSTKMLIDCLTNLKRIFKVE